MNSGTRARPINFVISLQWCPGFALRAHPWHLFQFLLISRDARQKRGSQISASDNKSITQQENDGHLVGLLSVKASPDTRCIMEPSDFKDGAEWSEDNFNLIPARLTVSIMAPRASNLRSYNYYRHTECLYHGFLGLQRVGWAWSCNQYQTH